MPLFLEISWWILVPLYIAIAYAIVCIVYFLIQERLIFIPINKVYKSGYRFTEEYEERFFNLDENIIHALHFKRPDSKGLIFYLHGNTGNLNRWGFMAQDLLSYGYDVIAIDYHGYGKSTGKRQEERMHADFVKVANEVFNEQSGKKVIYGRSLGSGFAVQLASKIKCDKLVLETPFSSLLDVASKVLPFIPTSFLLKFHLRSDQSINQVESPILIFHGTRDRVVSYSSAYKLYESIDDKSKVTFVSIPGGKHNNLSGYPIFGKSLSAFLD